MDTKAVDKEITLIAIGDHVAELNPKLVLELEDHEEESFDPRNRNGSCSNS